MSLLANRLQTPIPSRMQALDRDKRGYPIPYIVMRDLDERPFFAINDERKVRRCLSRKLCAICGRELTLGSNWLIGGPGAAFHENGVYIDTPMHYHCATYALRVCPYLATRYTKRIDDALAKHGRWGPESVTLVDPTMMPEQPDFFVLARATSITKVDNSMGGFYVKPRRPWKEVEFWKVGERLSPGDAFARLKAFKPDQLPFWPNIENLIARVHSEVQDDGH